MASLMPTLLTISSSGLSPRDALMSTLKNRHLGWNHLALLAGIAVFLITSFWDSFDSLFSLWQHSDHRHGTLVFPIVAFLIWRLRPVFENLPIVSEPNGLFIILGLLIAWTVSRLAGIQVAEHAIVLALIPATVYTVAGKEMVHKLMFPLLFLILATPIGDSLVPHLIIVTADVSTALLRMSGFPVLRDGQYISLPGGNFVVADVCSGIRYLTTGVMIAFLYSHLTYRSHIKWFVFIAVTVVTLVFANGIRAFLVMAIASASDLRYLGGRDHIYFGWIMFGIVIMLLMWIGGRYADQHFHIHSQESGDDDDEIISPSLPLIAVLALIMLATTTNPLQADLGNTSKYLVIVAIVIGGVLLASRRQPGVATDDARIDAPSGMGKWRSSGTIAIGVLLLVGVPQTVSFVEHASAQTVGDPQIEYLHGCTDPSPWMNRWFPRMQDPDLERAVTLTCSAEPVSIYAAGYVSALQGKEIISGSNRLIPEAWDRYSESSSVSFPDSDGRSRRVSEIYIDAPGYRGLVWYWYDIDGRWVTGEFAAKALQVFALARRHPAGGRVFLLETPVKNDQSTARRRLEGVANELINVASVTVNGTEE